jgi:hypothetical protein
VIIAFLFVLQMSCPDHAEHAMGFSQSASKHTFKLFADGGAIEVRSSDAATVKAIRQHLQMIAKDFAAGDFAKPLAVHDQNPDGVATMQELRGEIAYAYSEIESGGRVRITTKNPRALEAVHQFLRFQIREHKTGDSDHISESNSST